MNIFNKVTVRSLHKNRVRTVVTVIGVILSAAMICAVTTFAQSMFDYLVRGIIYNDGDWYAHSTVTSESELNSIIKEQEVSASYIVANGGYAEFESDNHYKPYLYIAKADTAFMQKMPVHITQGRLPLTQYEIILPESLYEQNPGFDYSIGDTINIDVGERVSYDGYTLDQSYSLEVVDDTVDVPIVTEKIINTIPHSYKIVGYYERASFEPYTAPGYTAITVYTGFENTCDVYFKTKDAAYIYEFAENKKISADFNYEYLLYSGVSTGDVMLTIYLMCAIVIIIIMFGSVSLIYNAFAISVSERTRQFGLLVSVGATRKQIRRSVLFEAFYISVLGIPIGIFCGIVGIGITLKGIAGSFEALTEDVPLRLCVSPASVLIAVAVAFLTVLISVIIPAVKATRTTAIETIRMNSDIKFKPEKYRTSSVVSKLFGFEGMLADKYYKRSKKRFRTTVISLFMSVVIFISSSSIGHYTAESVNINVKDNPYDIYLRYDNSSAADVCNVKNIFIENGAETAYYYEQTYKTGVIQNKYLNDKFVFGEDGSYSEISFRIVFIEDSFYNSYLKSQNLDSSLYNGANAAPVICSRVNTFSYEEGKFINSDLIDPSVDRIGLLKWYDEYGDSYHIKDESIPNFAYFTDESEEITVKQYDDVVVDIKLSNAAFTSSLPNISNTDAATIMYPYSAKETVISTLGGITENSTIVCGNAKDHKKVYEDIKYSLIENNIEKDAFIDYAAENENARNMIFIINVFAYGFIILISLIAVANVFNTVSTNIALRRREFAMLSSVGMTQKSLMKMMNYECILYGVRSLMFGLPISIAISYLIYLAVKNSYDAVYAFPLAAVLIAVFSVFAVVFLTMMYSMNKLKKDNIIEAIRNENN